MTSHKKRPCHSLCFEQNSRPAIQLRDVIYLYILIVHETQLCVDLMTIVLVLLQRLSTCSLTIIYKQLFYLDLLMLGRAES